VKRNPTVAGIARGEVERTAAAIDPTRPFGLMIEGVSLEDDEPVLHERTYDTYEQALEGARYIASDPTVTCVRIVQGPMIENPTEHWPFARLSQLGPGPLKRRFGRVDDWECTCGQYKCVCRGTSPDTRGRRKTIVTDPERKKRYNKMYREWVARRGGGR